MGMLEGKVVLVTGAGSGIGEATARLAAAEGAEAVVVADINRDAAAAVANDIGRVASSAELDVTDEASVEALIRACVEAFGRLDCAHNNAGINGPGFGFDMPLEDWQRMIDVNLTSVFLCMRHELRVMAAAGHGAIVNTSSGAGLVAAPGLPHYTAAKHGVLGLTKAAASEYAAKGIRVNAVLPGSTRTPMLEQFMSLAPDIEKMITRSVARGSLGAPNEIAEGVVWLLSDRASFTSGTSLVIDGGSICR